MYFIYIFRIKRNCAVTFFREKSLKTELKTVYALNTVAVPKTAYNSADNVVKSGTKTSASTDTGIYIMRIKINKFTGTGFLHEIR